MQCGGLCTVSFSLGERGKERAQTDLHEVFQGSQGTSTSVVGSVNSQGRKVVQGWGAGHVFLRWDVLLEGRLREKW